MSRANRTIMAPMRNGGPGMNCQSKAAARSTCCWIWKNRFTNYFRQWSALSKTNGNDPKSSVEAVPFLTISPSTLPISRFSHETKNWEIVSSSPIWTPICLDRRNKTCGKSDVNCQWSALANEILTHDETFLLGARIFSGILRGAISDRGPAAALFSSSRSTSNK